MTATPTSDGAILVAQAGPSPLTGTPADPHADTHATTEAPGGAGHQGAFPPFAPEHFANQLVWLAITFGALYYLMSRVALPRVGGILAARQSRIEADLAEAHRLRAETEAATAAYEKALADARARAQSIASETRDQVSREADTKRRALEAELNERLAAAEAQIATTKTAALANVRGIAIDAGGAIVERLTGTAPTPAELESAVDAALARR